jgi:sulfofructosephosphate aldolase
LDLIAEFVTLARDRGALALVEGIVMEGTHESVSAEDFLRATAAVARGADVYEAQMPTHMGADDVSITALASEMSAVIPCPWVVLSNGVPAARFPSALTAACRGGASGFLAGRAVWGPAAADEVAALDGPCRSALHELRLVAALEARPWWKAVPGDARPGVAR